MVIKYTKIGSLAYLYLDIFADESFENLERKVLLFEDNDTVSSNPLAIQSYF